MPGTMQGAELLRNVRRMEAANLMRPKATMALYTTDISAELRSELPSIEATHVEKGNMEAVNAFFKSCWDQPELATIIKKK